MMAAIRTRFEILGCLLWCVAISATAQTTAQAILVPGLGGESKASPEHEPRQPDKPKPASEQRNVLRFAPQDQAERDTFIKEREARRSQLRRSSPMSSSVSDT